jgi:MarR family transcriptional regulator, organic hydroperoxide resistance regulator
MKKSIRRGTASEGEILELDQFLPYLFHLITAGLSNRFLGRLRPNGVTVQRWRVLMVVMNRGPRNMSELMKLTLIPQSALSRLVDQMERDRLVVRRLSDLDTRVVEVELTDHGRQMYWRLVPTAIAHAEAIVENFDEKERKMLYSLLRRVLANLQVDAFSGEGPGENPNPTTPGIRTRKSAVRQDQRLEGRDKIVKRKAIRASEPKTSATRRTALERSKGR